jgi:hypothetical protein
MTPWPPAAVYPAANLPLILLTLALLLASAVDASPTESAIDNRNLNGAIIVESSYSEPRLGFGVEFLPNYRKAPRA